MCAAGLPRNCEFDSASDTCDLIQDGDDQDDWMMIFDRTPSDDTGPETGYQASRGFIYYEATNKVTGDKAR